MDRLARLRTPVLAIAWLAVAALFALGGAGIVAGADHPPGSGGRPELTAAGDAAVAAELDAASTALADVAAHTTELGDAGRGALASLVAADTAGLANEVAAGETALDAIDASVAELRARLEAVPLGAPDAAIRHSPAAIARYDRLVTALPATVGLRAAWESLVVGSEPAVELAGHLAAHDARAGEAVLAGSKGRYADALTGLDAAAKELDIAVTIRDRLAKSADVSTLDGWISRSRAIDAALGHLYTLLETSRGRVTPDVQTALAAVDAARASLPPDTRALVVILADIARGGLNQAVIAIEEARGRLAAAAAGSVQ